MYRQPWPDTVSRGAPMLTEAKVRAAKPRAKQYKMHDARALALLVTPTGSRLWRFNYRFGGKQQSLALGAYPDVSLVRARELRDEARRLLAAGVNPSERRKAEKAAARAARQEAETAFTLRNDGALAIHLDRRRVELTPAETAELRAFLDATRNLHTKVSSC